jgi:solute carrier family 25 (mitochondrial phosphate transporter), member 23/24/25/41
VLLLVSRTSTAPFDRLKIFLITRPPDLGGTTLGSKPGIGGMKAIWTAVARIYAEGGLLSFWTGNGLSVAKIFPESAIKFFTYESSVSHCLIRWCGFPMFISSRNGCLLNIGITLMTPEISVAPVGSCQVELVEFAVNSVYTSHSPQFRHNLILSS